MIKWNEDSEIFQYLFNKQFELIGCEINYQELKESNFLIPNKKGKGIPWWSTLSFSTYEDWLSWIYWLTAEIKKRYSSPDPKREALNFDLLYGLNYKNGNT